MAGTVETLRVAGTPDSGYPSEIDSDLKVRWVAPLVTNMSERSADLLKYFGGPEKFEYNTEKIDWVEDDPWNRRLTHTGLVDANDTSLVVTGAAHRFPIGTIFFHVADSEYVRVTAHVDVNTLTIVRDITAAVAEGAWAASDEVFVAGFAMSEDDDWVFRPTSIMSTSFNYSQVHSLGVQATFRRIETNLYGLQGSDLDHQAAATVAEQFVLIEMETAHGSRFKGANASRPAMLGGVKHYVTSANGSVVNDLLTNPIVRSDIDDLLEELYYSVGGERMARTMLVSAWAKRKISSFYTAAERLGPGTTDAGVVVDRLNTDFGPVDILLHTALAKDEIIFIRREQHQIGHHGQLGRPQLRQLPPSTTGPRVQQAFYADLSMLNTGQRAEGRLHNFSITN